MHQEALPRRLVTASEIGEFTYCAKYWSLKKREKVPRSPEMERGIEHHVREGRALSRIEKIRSWSESLFWLLLSLLLALFVLLYFL